LVWREERATSLINRSDGSSFGLLFLVEIRITP